MTIDYDLFSPENWQDPYPAYRRLRDEAPVHRSEENGLYPISRYDRGTLGDFGSRRLVANL